MKELDLSIIILNFNTRVLLGQCLDSILNSDNFQIGRQKKKSRWHGEVIVVDNASTDGSPRTIRSEYPWVMLIKSEKNLGFAKGNNLGIKKSNGRYVLLLNPDTLLQSDTLSKMINYMDKHPSVGASTCRVELLDGRLDYSCHRGFPTPINSLAYFSGLAKLFPKIRLLNSYTMTYLSMSKTHEIDAGCGAFLMIRTAAGQEIGWLDEDYFWYGEDLDFCYRLKQKKWKVIYVAKTKIIHYKGAASGIVKHSQKVSTATREIKKNSTKASVEVMRIFFKKHYQNRYPRWIGWLVMKGINVLENIRMSKFR